MPQESAAIQPLTAEQPSVVVQDGSDSSEGSEARLPHSCRCGARWAGTRTAHCGGSCHLTFNGVSPFDDHRRGGACTPPQELGMTLVFGRAYDCWGYPAEGMLPEPTAAERLASGEICQLGQPAPCGDYHNAGQCVRPRTGDAFAAREVP